MLVTIGVIVFLLVLSGFFSGSETALTGASRPLMHQLEQKGDRRAGMVNRLRERKERLIGALLLGNNLVNILASAMATSLMIAMFGESGVVYATAVMTVLVLIFSEILPKTYAFRNANETATKVVPVVAAVVFLLGPFAQAFNLVVRGIFRIFGMDYRTSDAFEMSEEELRGAIELHTSEEEEDEAIREERAMLRSVLDLDDVQVGEIMVHRRNVNMIDADDSLDSIVTQVLDSPFTRIPIYRERPDNIVGILHVKALLRALHAQGADLGSVEIVDLAATPWFVPESTTLLDQLQAFQERREHFALVVDEYGSLMGIVTLEDIIEEIVGDISDEHDVAVPGVRRQPDGSFIVHAQVTIRDLNRRFEWSLPDEETATVAGLILHETRRIPEVGQAFKFHGCRFEIMRRVRHQITLVRITPPGVKAPVQKLDAPVPPAASGE